MDLALVQVNEAEFAGGANAFSPPRQDLLGRRDRLLVLAVPQVVAGAAVPVAQALHRSVHGRGADPDTQACRQHLAQVADAPDRDRQPVRLGARPPAPPRGTPAPRRSAWAGDRSAARRRGPAAARQKPGPPSADAVRPRLEQARDRGHGPPLGDQQQGVRRRRTRGSGSVRVRPRRSSAHGARVGPSQHLRPRRRTHRSKTSLRLLSASNMARSPGERSPATGSCPHRRRLGRARHDGGDTTVATGQDTTDATRGGATGPMIGMRASVSSTAPARLEGIRDAYLARLVTRIRIKVLSRKNGPLHGSAMTSPPRFRRWTRATPPTVRSWTRSSTSCRRSGTQPGEETRGIAAAGPRRLRCRPEYARSATADCERAGAGGAFL